MTDKSKMSSENEIGMSIVNQFMMRDKNSNIVRVDYLKILAYLDDNDSTKNDICLYAMCLMSNSYENILKFRENVKLLHLLLGHAGIFDNCGTRRRMFTRLNSPKNGFYSFWSHCIPDHTMRRFLCEIYVPAHEKSFKKSPPPCKIKKTDSVQLTCCNLCPCQNQGLDGLCDEKSGYFSKDWMGESCPDSEMDSLTQKMIIIGDTVRNLSVDTENSAFMAKNPTFMRYLLLSLHCSVPYLKTTALEVLNNISPFMNMAEPEKRLVTQHFISFVSRGLQNKNPLIQMKCFISLGGWYAIRENPTSKRAAQKNYSSLNKFERLNLDPISPALHKYILEKDIISVDLILQCILEISSHGKRGCDDLCNKVDDIVKMIVALCTPDLIYSWETLQTYLRLKNLNPYKNIDASITSGSNKKGTKGPKPISSASTTQIPAPTEYCIVDASVPGSCPKIVDLIPNIEAKFGNIPENYAKFPKNHKFLPEDEECLGMTFETFEENLRIKACAILKNIAKVSAVGRKMILQYDTRLILQSFMHSHSIPENIIVEILETLGSKYAKLKPPPPSG